MYDPEANANATQVFPTLCYVGSVREALTGADAVLLLTEWREFLDLDPQWTAEQVTGRMIVDGRLCLDPDAWRGAGWEYYAPGRP